MRDANGIGDPHFSSFHRPLAYHRSQERGLPCSIWTNEAHYVSPPNPGRETVQEHPLSDRDADVLRYQHLVAASGIRLEPEGQHTLFSLRSAKTADA
jgi:hypothetical protein